MSEGILDKYSAFIEKLEQSDVKKPDLVVACLAIASICFIVVLVYLIVPITYGLTVSVTFNASPVSGAKVILYDANSINLGSKLTNARGQAVFEGSFLKYVARIYAQSNENNLSRGFQGIFQSDVFNLELFSETQNSNNVSNGNNTSNKTGFCSDNTPVNSCSLTSDGSVKGDGYYCNDQSQLVLQNPQDETGFSCYKCAGGVAIGECQLDSFSQNTGNACKLVSGQPQFVQDSTCQAQVTCTKGSETVSVGECFTSSDAGGYYCAAKNDVRQDKIKCKDYLPQDPTSSFLNPDGTTKSIQNQTIQTSSLTVSIYDNSSTAIDGVNVKFVLKNWLQDKKTGVIVNTVTSNQSTIVFSNLTVGAYYYVDVQAGDCQVSVSSKELIISKDQLKNLIKVTLPIKFYAGSCYPAYPYSDHTFIAGGLSDSQNFTIFSSGVSVSYDVYSEDYDPEIPDKDTKYTVVQKDGTPVKLFVRPDKNYFVVAYTKSYLPETLEVLQFNVTNLVNFTKAINTINSWKSGTANSGSLNVYLYDVNGKPIKNAVVKVSKLISSVGNLKLDFSRYFEKIIPFPSQTTDISSTDTSLGSSDSTSIDYVLKTGDDGWLNVSSLPIDSNKNSFIVDADWNGVLSGEKEVQINDQKNILKIQLVYEYTGLTVKTLDVFDGKPIDATISIVHPYTKGNPDFTSSWTCETSAVSDCVLTPDQKIFGLTDFLINVTPKDPKSGYKPVLVSQKISTQLDAANNVFTFKFFKSRDQPQVSVDFNDVTKGTSPSPLYSVSAKGVLQLRVKLIPSKDPTNYTGVIVKLANNPSSNDNPVGNSATFYDDVSDTTPNKWYNFQGITGAYTGYPQTITTQDCGVQGLDENGLTTFDKPSAIDKIQAKRGAYTYVVLWFKNSDIPATGRDVWFNVKLNLGSGNTDFNVYYSAFSSSGGFVLRNPVDEAFKATSVNGITYYSIAPSDEKGPNFCSAKSSSTSIPVQKTDPSYYCSQLYCFVLTSLKQSASVSGTNSFLNLKPNSVILNNSQPVVLRGSIFFMKTIPTTGTLSNYVVIGDSKLMPFEGEFSYSPGSNTASIVTSQSTTLTVPIPTDLTTFTAASDGSAQGNIKTQFSIDPKAIGSTGFTLKIPSFDYNGVKISSLILNMPLQIATNATLGSKLPNVTLSDFSPGDCSGKVVLHYDVDNSVWRPSCNTLKFRVNSIFPADGIQILFDKDSAKYLLNKWPSGEDILLFNTSDELGMANGQISTGDINYAKDAVSCFSLKQLDKSMFNEYETADSQIAAGYVLRLKLSNCTAVSRVGPFFNVFKTFKDGKTLFNGTFTLNFTTTRLDLNLTAENFSVTDGLDTSPFDFPRTIDSNGAKVSDPSFLAYKVKLFNSSIDPGSKNYENISVGLVLDNNQFSAYDAGSGAIYSPFGPIQFNPIFEFNSLQNRSTTSFYTNLIDDDAIKFKGFSTGPDTSQVQLQQKFINFSNLIPYTQTGNTFEGSVDAYCKLTSVIMPKLQKNTLFWRSNTLREYCECIPLTSGQPEFTLNGVPTGCAADSSGTKPQIDFSTCKATENDWFDNTQTQLQYNTTCTGGFGYTVPGLQVNASLTSCYQLLRNDGTECDPLNPSDANYCPSGYADLHPVSYYDDSCLIGNNFDNPIQGSKQISAGQLVRYLPIDKSTNTVDYSLNNWFFGTSSTSCDVTTMTSELARQTNTKANEWTAQGNILSIDVSSPAITDKDATAVLSYSGSTQKYVGSQQKITCVKIANGADYATRDCGAPSPFQPGTRTAYDKLSLTKLQCNPGCNITGSTAGNITTNYNITNQTLANTSMLFDVTVDNSNSGSSANKYYPYAYFAKDLDNKFEFRYPLNLLNATASQVTEVMTNMADSSSCKTNGIIGFSIHWNTTDNSCGGTDGLSSSDYRGLYELVLGFNYQSNSASGSVIVPFSNATPIGVNNFVNAQGDTPASQVKCRIPSTINTYSLSSTDKANHLNNYLCGKLVAFAPTDEENHTCIIGLNNPKIVGKIWTNEVERDKSLLVNFGCITNQCRPAAFQTTSQDACSPINSFYSIQENGVVGWLDDANPTFYDKPFKFADTVKINSIKPSSNLINPDDFLTVKVYPQGHHNFTSFLSTQVNPSASPAPTSNPLITTSDFCNDVYTPTDKTTPFPFYCDSTTKNVYFLPTIIRQNPDASQGADPSDYYKHGWKYDSATTLYSIEVFSDASNYTTFNSVGTSPSSDVAGTLGLLGLPGNYTGLCINSPGKIKNANSPTDYDCSLDQKEFPTSNVLTDLVSKGEVQKKDKTYQTDNLPLCTLTGSSGSSTDTSPTPTPPPDYDSLCSQSKSVNSNQNDPWVYQNDPNTQHKFVCISENILLNCYTDSANLPNWKVMSGGVYNCPKSTATGTAATYTCYNIIKPNSGITDPSLVYVCDPKH